MKEAAWSPDELDAIVGALTGMAPDLPRPFTTTADLVLVADKIVAPVALLSRMTAAGVEK